MEDKRFDKIKKNPKFKSFNVKKNKIDIDDRFKDVFGKKFQTRKYVDKRGRSVTDVAVDDFNSLYKLENQDDIIGIRGENINSDSIDSSSVDSLSSVQDDNLEVDNDVLSKWREDQFENVSKTKNITRRLALCNMDWEKIDCNDIFAIFKSFLPQKTKLLCVSIYLSQFGKEKLALEHEHGPIDFFNKLKSKNITTGDDDNDENSDEKELVNELYREYELQRLRYYYAVLEFDSTEAADFIYNECDEMDYENSSVPLDLRFIPDHIEFDKGDMVSSCTFVEDNYKPLDFYLEAFNKKKLNMVWDDINPKRKMITHNRNFDVENNKYEMEKLIASPSSEGNEYNTDKYQQLLEDSEESSIDSIPKLEEISSETEYEAKMPNNIKEAFQNDPFLSINRPRKRKFEEVKLENKKMQTDGVSSLKEPGLYQTCKKLNLSKKKARKLLLQRKQNKLENEDITIDGDTRFNAIYKSSNFAIDPASNNFKKTVNMERIIKKQSIIRKEVPSKEKTMDLDSLVDRVKKINVHKR